jgi:hypothetical protein
MDAADGAQQRSRPVGPSASRTWRARKPPWTRRRHTRARCRKKASSLPRSALGRRTSLKARHMLRANQSQLELLRRQLADSELVAPMRCRRALQALGARRNGHPAKTGIQSGHHGSEVGPEPMFRVRSGKDSRTGMKASISTDSFPGPALSGWVGFIASVAEFTPKAVQTAELRSSLVYEIRVFVQDPQDQMRLGMPATVLLRVGSGRAEQALGMACAHVRVVTISSDRISHCRHCRRRRLRRRPGLSPRYRWMPQARGSRRFSRRADTDQQRHARHPGGPRSTMSNSTP